MRVSHSCALAHEWRERIRGRATDTSPEKLSTAAPLDVAHTIKGEAVSVVRTPQDLSSTAQAQALPHPIFLNTTIAQSE